MFFFSFLRCRYGGGVWDAAAVHDGDRLVRPHYGFLSWRSPDENAEDAHPASDHLQPHHRRATHTHPKTKFSYFCFLSAVDADDVIFFCSKLVHSNPFLCDRPDSYWRN